MTEKEWKSLPKEKKEEIRKKLNQERKIREQKIQETALKIEEILKGNKISFGEAELVMQNVLNDVKMSAIIQ